MHSPSLYDAPRALSDAAPLSGDQLQSFRDRGYIALANVLSPSELQESRDALTSIARDAVGNPDAFERKGQGNGTWFQHRTSPLFVQIEPGQDASTLQPADMEAVVRKYMWFSKAAPVFTRILGEGGMIQRIVTSLIGANPLLFQEMALVKPPYIGSEKPWHQDNAYFSVAPLDAVIGVWIALDDAEPENGCMHVLPGGHKLGPRRHFHGMDCEIEHDRLDPAGALAVPVPAGGAMFFYGLLPHQTPPNRSPLRRRALQFHYRAATSTIVDEALYNTLFAEADGTPASCRAATVRKQVR
ncbi:hypothetical protein DB346_02035 [Verrucomicrobia bacterium LW23]|nr:hypothetical protein DB346_02035 [Verrucomicrobia bacterium LW23]